MTYNVCSMCGCKATGELVRCGCVALSKMQAERDHWRHIATDGERESLAKEHDALTASLARLEGERDRCLEALRYAFDENGMRRLIHIPEVERMKVLDALAPAPADGKNHQACQNYQPIGTVEGPEGEHVSMRDCYVCGASEREHVK